MKEEFKTEKIVITADFNNVRLDNFLLQNNKDFSRSFYKSLITKGDVLLNNTQAKAGEMLREGDEVLICYPKPNPQKPLPQKINLNIVYEDDDVVVVNKEKGMVVHPASGNWDNTLVNALLYNVSSLSDINGENRPGIVHRLDKDTTGLLVVAKNNDAHAKLSEQFKNNTVKRKYLALLKGNLSENNGVIKTYIKRDSKNRLRFAVSENSGKFAQTCYNVLQRYTGYCLVEFDLKTGRTHQIRVHSKHLNHPIVGDELYGGKSAIKVQGQMLHAHKLAFIHPKTKKELCFTCDLPNYFNNILKSL